MMPLALMRPQTVRTVRAGAIQHVATLLDFQNPVFSAFFSHDHRIKVDNYIKKSACVI